MIINDAKTILGIPLLNALKGLDKCLPPQAYKAIAGGPGAKAGLTDIIPAYTFELITSLFGPMGIGWGYDELEYQRDDKGYVEVKVLVWYKLSDGTKVEWTARGGNSNNTSEWAAKGALTNALGAAWSMQGLQASVYKDIRDHQNAHAEWRKQNPGADGSAGTQGRPTAQNGQKSDDDTAGGQPHASRGRDAARPTPPTSREATPPAERRDPPPPPAGEPAGAGDSKNLINILRARNVKVDNGYAFPAFSDAASRDAIKKAGGKWDGSKKAWKLPMAA